MGSGGASAIPETPVLRLFRPAPSGKALARVGAVGAVGLQSRASAKRLATAAAVRRLPAGSLRSRRRITPSNHSGNDDRNCRGGIGSAEVTARNTSATDWPGNGTRPVAITYSTQPRLNESE